MKWPVESLDLRADRLPRTFEKQASASNMSTETLKFWTRSTKKRHVYRYIYFMYFLCWLESTVLEALMSNKPSLCNRFFCWPLHSMPTVRHPRSHSKQTSLSDLRMSKLHAAESLTHSTIRWRIGRKLATFARIVWTVKPATSYQLSGAVSNWTVILMPVLISLKRSTNKYV